MLPAPIPVHSVALPTVARWGIAVFAWASAAAACAAFAGGRPVGFVGVFALDVLLAVLATLANEPTLDPARDSAHPHPSPEELALYACLHCGVLALLLISFPSGLIGAGLLAAHQGLLWVNVRRLPAA